MVRFDRMGESGNIFWIMSSASHELKEQGRTDDAKEMVERVIKSESYDDALEIVGEYVELEEAEEDE